MLERGQGRRAKQGPSHVRGQDCRGAQHDICKRPSSQAQPALGGHVFFGAAAAAVLLLNRVVVGTLQLKPRASSSFWEAVPLCNHEPPTHHTSGKRQHLVSSSFAASVRPSVAAKGAVAQRKIKKKQAQEQEVCSSRPSRLWEAHRTAQSGKNPAKKIQTRRFDDTQVTIQSRYI